MSADVAAMNSLCTLLGERDMDIRELRAQIAQLEAEKAALRARAEEAEAAKAELEARADEAEAKIHAQDKEWNAFVDHMEADWTEERTYLTKHIERFVSTGLIGQDPIRGGPGRQRQGGRLPRRHQGARRLGA